MIFRLLALLAILTISNVYADARLIVHLTDYLANDYAGAVSEEEKVLSDGEYAEQIEFSQTALKEGKTNSSLNQNTELLKDLYSLNNAIAKKSPPSLVIPLARKIQKNVIEISGISLSPASWPNYAKAKIIFNESCISCHGSQGRGDGPDGVGLDPAPANFHDMERAPKVSPFAAFNTIRLGVPGTGMSAFGELSDDEVWALAFYVSSFRFGEPVKSRELISEHFSNEEILEKAAALNDEELKNILKTRDSNPNLVEKVRLYFFDSESSDYLSRAENLLNESVLGAESGSFELAEKLSLEAYFLGIEPVENKISANDPSAVTRIEEHMAAFRNAIKVKSVDEIKKQHAILAEELNTLKVLLSGQKVTPGIAFISGFSIILREGFEAVLVILAILGVGKAAASSMVNVAIHTGWITSLVLGIIGWFVSGWLISMSGASREIMEAIAAFFAVFVLIYVGFWMHRQTEIHRWKEFINVKVRNLAQTKNLVGLFILSFFVTFREVIETVLFLRTVYLDTGDGIKIYILSGVLVAFAIVLIVSILMSKFRNQISLKKFFNLSSVLMMFLATTLSGKGMHALQEAGVASMSVFPVKLRIEILGIFPSWETFISQILVLGASIFIWKMAGKKPTSL
jgi:high-affinity iron transporter